MSIVLLRSHTTTTTTAHHNLQGGNFVEEIRKVKTSHDHSYNSLFTTVKLQTADVIWRLFLMTEPAASQSSATHFGIYVGA